jgi:hypothetical protein
VANFNVNVGFAEVGMEVKEQEVVEQVVEAEEIKELDVTLLAKIGGGCGRVTLD